MNRAWGVGLGFFFWAGSLGARPPLDITSDRVRVIHRGAEVEFTGHVVLKRDGGVLTADRLVTRDDSPLVYAWGRVTYERRVDERFWTAQGDEAVYDTDRSSGTLSSPRGSVRATSAPAPGAPPAAQLALWSRQVTFWIPPGASQNAPANVDAVGGVYAITTEPEPLSRVTRLWSGGLFHDAVLNTVFVKDAPVSLTGVAPPAVLDRPFARQTMGPDTREVWGETMTLFLKEHRLKVDRRASARLEFPLVKNNVPAR